MGLENVHLHYRKSHVHSLRVDFLTQNWKCNMTGMRYDASLIALMEFFKLNLYTPLLQTENEVFMYDGAQ